MEHRFSQRAKKDRESMREKILRWAKEEQANAEAADIGDDVDDFERDESDELGGV